MVRLAATPPENAAERGIVFDLQRASLHDGPGIRTTVFLKGCALRCAWCHNPESRRLRPQLGYDPAKCLGCRACVDACEHGVHSFDAAGLHLVNWSRCTASGNCVPTCQGDALRLYGGEKSVDDVMTEVLKDRDYYASSGGGLTISGGEPTTQLAFCTALLRAAKAAGLHTCLETCGISPRAAYEKVLPHTDLFLFDYKATGDATHRALIGAPADSILVNLRWLHAQGAAILLRCPMIPSVNDTPAHLAAIAALSRELTGLRGVEVLPYHDIGEGKYDRIGEPRPGLPTHVPTPDEITAWRRTLTEAGCVGLV